MIQVIKIRNLNLGNEMNLHYYGFAERSWELLEADAADGLPSKLQKFFNQHELLIAEFAVEKF